MSAECHVRKLHIRTCDKTLLPRMTFALEDAFRTASFPGVPPNGKVFIRKLNLGKCSPTSSGAVLSRKIDEQFRLIRPVKISENLDEQPSASAVWFADDLSPYRYMIHFLSKNIRPMAWYWPAAIKGWSAKLTLRESYYLILSSVSEHVTGIRGISFVIDPLIVSGKVHEVLDSFQPKEVVHLLMILGISQLYDMNQTGYVNPEQEAEVFIVPPLFCSLILKAVRMWSVFDPRTQFLASVVLDRMGKKTAVAQVNRLLEVISESETPIDELGSRQKEQSYAVHKSNSKILVNEKDLHHQELNCSTAQRQLESFPEKKTSDNIRQYEVVAPENMDQDIPLPVSEKRKTAERTSTPFREHSLTETWPSFGGLAGDLSEHTGLVFVISLMKRLGLDALLDMYPDYLELKIPQRIFFRCAELINISMNDPVLAFAGDKPMESYQFVDFVAPQEWIGTLNLSASESPPFRLGRINGIPGHRLIYDAEEKLIIGLWNSQNRRLLEPWFEGVKKPFGTVSPQGWSVQHLVENMVCAMKHYLRLHAHMKLSELISRPAYISTTKTHLDVSIPFKELDIRVRMAGLDINPGWVPWLGRVIQFHYVGGDH